MQFSKTFACAGLIAVANAHMKIVSPQPFDQTVDNSPLLADGSNYPCKANGSPFTGPTNTYALGSQQTLSLIGTAVHGGGSCQMSISYDTNPTKSSTFKVIHTIQGGCPARDQVGNLDGNSAALADNNTYSYTIPSNLPAGDATIAWSWVNRVGNREFYMNCGKVTLTGTGGDKSNYDALPDLFVANIPSVSTCTTDSLGSGTDAKWVLIPNPGTSVETNSMFGSGPPDNCPAGSGSSGSGSGSTATAVTSATAVTTTHVATSAGAASPTGGIFITTPVAGASSASSATVAVPTTTAKAATTAVATSAAATATAGSSGGSTGNGLALSGACSSAGMFNCVGGSSYQQCASGTWSEVQALAAGTSCTTGQTMNLSIAASGRKRSMRAFRG